jgi:hypothetical protein
MPAVRRLEERWRTGKLDEVPVRLGARPCRRRTIGASRRCGNQLRCEGLRLAACQGPTSQPPDNGSERFARHAARRVEILEALAQLAPRFRPRRRQERGAAFRRQIPDVNEQLSEPGQGTRVGCGEGRGQLPRDGLSVRLFRGTVLGEAASRLAQPRNALVARIEDSHRAP